MPSDEDLTAAIGKRQFSLSQLKDYLKGKKAIDEELRNLFNLAFMRAETSGTLPDLLFKIGVLAQPLQKPLATC